MVLTRRLVAEFVGTFWLVFGGCGAAVLSASFPDLGIGFLGVAFAFGLTVLTMAYAIGHISGCHLNPAVSIGLWAGRRFPAKDLLPYIVVQVVGAIVGAGVLLVIASGKPGFDITVSNLAANGYADHSPGGYSLAAALVTEIVLTFMFLVIILGATDGRAPKGFAPIAIGLGLTLIHLIGIPVTNLSVNPARSTVQRSSSADGRSANYGCSGLRRSSVRCWPAWSIRGWALVRMFPSWANPNPRPSRRNRPTQPDRRPAQTLAGGGSASIPMPHMRSRSWRE